MANGVRNNSNFPSIDKSEALWERAKKTIPSGTQTLAKGPSQFVGGVSPIFLQRGKGARVWDVDGNEFLDYNMGIGPLSLGYAYHKVDQAIAAQLRNGISFSLVHPLEVEVAELLRETIPNAEMVRFSKTGADVTSAAIRVARHHTKRSRVLCCGYHGWHDWYIGTSPLPNGVPTETRGLTSSFSYNDIESLQSQLDENVACIIMEPALFEEPRDNFLHKVRDLATQNGSLLIFDEMWTGFRLAPGGAQEFFGVTADLATFSKAIANGMPLSALTGRREVMEHFDGEVFFYTTFGGETLSLAAAQATVTEIRDQDVCSHMRTLGNRLKEGIEKAIARRDMGYVACKGYGCRTLITFNAEASDPLLQKSLIQQELIKRGILWSGQHAISFSHTEQDMDYTISAYEEALDLLDCAIREGTLKEAIQGRPVQPVFRTTTGQAGK